MLSALVREEPDAIGNRHIGRVSLVLEVLDRHQGRPQRRDGPLRRPRD
jgi:hypothetical protein